MKRLRSDNLQDLASRLGVSVSTVSRVLSGKAEKFRISAATQRRIQSEASKSGVVVNQIARGLRLQNTHTVGLVIPDISNPFFASLARQVEHSARARGYSVLLADSQERSALEMESVQLMLSRRVDALVVAPVGEACDHLKQLSDAAIPLVLVDRIFPTLPVASVTSDHYEGARLAVRHLAAQGHKAIACLQGLPGSYANQQRVEGFRQGLREANLKFDPEWLVGSNYALESGSAATLKLFDGKIRPTALLALGNLIALGALLALAKRNLRVPTDLSMISFDEQPWAALLAPGMTTVSQPIKAMGERAMELLFAQLEEKGAFPHATAGPVVLPVSLVKRGSVAPPGSCAA